MQVTRLEFNEGTLVVTCDGEHGVGSDGRPSAGLLKSTIESWLQNHPGQSVAQIDVDYTDVNYSWGDGPVSSMIGFSRQGKTRIRLIAGPDNFEALAGLVKSCNIPFIEVVNERQS